MRKVNLVRYSRLECKGTDGHRTRISRAAGIDCPALTGVLSIRPPSQASALACLSLATDPAGYPLGRDPMGSYHQRGTFVTGKRDAITPHNRRWTAMSEPLRPRPLAPLSLPRAEARHGQTLTPEHLPPRLPFPVYRPAGIPTQHRGDLTCLG